MKDKPVLDACCGGKMFYFTQVQAQKKIYSKNK